MANEPWDKKIQAIRNALDETTEVMHQNIDKILERGENINALQEKTEKLAANSVNFKGKTRELRDSAECCGCINPLIRSMTSFFCRCQ